MGRLSAAIVMTLLAGVLVLAGCMNREEASTERVAEGGEPTPVANETPSPTSEPAETSAPESMTTPDAEANTVEELDIPRYELPSGNREIYVIDSDGGNEQQLTDDQNQHNHPVWSPDGTRIASITFDRDQPGQRIFVMDAEGSNRRTITRDAGHGPISWSPVGETIAFGTANNPQAEGEEIYLIDADGENQRQLTNRDGIESHELYTSARSPVWSPDRESIAFTAVRLGHDHNGSVVVEIYVVDTEGDGVPRRLTDTPGIQKSALAWSPEGESIAFAGTSENGTEQAIYAVDADGGNLRQLAEDVNHPAGLTWSPDGQRIAFSQELFANQDIYVMDADGSDITRLTDDESANESPAWSPDGARIAFVANRDARLAEPCSYHEVADLAPREPFEDLAWISHQVVIGTVTERQDPAWAEPDVFDRPGRSSNCLQIMTDYVVEVESQYRGEPADALRVRVRGGQIGEYEQQIEPSPEFDEGDRLLLFLTEAQESELLPDAHPVYVQRVWWVNESDQIVANGPVDDSDTFGLAEVDRRIRDALSGESHIIGTRLVPPDEAPIQVDRDEGE